MASGTVTVNIIGDANSLKSALGQGESSLSSFAAKAQEVGARATSIGRSMTLGVSLPLIGLGKVAFDELEQSAKASAQTEAAIRSTGGAAHVTAKQVDEMATALLNKTGIDDEVVKGGENVLLTFRGIRNEAGAGNDIFNQATKATLDLSVAFGKDMTSSAILVGKALQDPIQGIGALQRVGVQFTAAQKEQIKALVESGDVMGAQKIILKELTTEVGGSADAYGKSMAGQVSKAKEELKNAGAEIMATAAPAVKTLADFALGAARAFAGLPEPVQAVGLGLAAIVAVAGPATYIFGAVAKAVSGAIPVFETMSSATETLALKSMYAKDWIGQNAAAIGGWSVVAGLAVGAAVGLSQAFGDNTVNLQANIAALRDLTQAQLANWIQKLAEAGDKLQTNNLVHSAFLSILSQDNAEAQVFINSLQGLGQNTEWYEGKLKQHIATQQQANAEHAAGAQRLKELGERVNNLPPGKDIPINVTGNATNVLGDIGVAVANIPTSHTIDINVVRHDIGGLGF